MLLGQSVRITGAGSQALPSWGSGGFTVQQFGTLSLTGVLLEGGLIVQSGGSLTIGSSTVSGTITVQSGGTLHLSQVRLTPSVCPGNSYFPAPWFT